MLEFKEISLDDKPWIDELLSVSDFMGCEYSFANNLAWRRLNDSKIARFKDFYINCACKNNSVYFTFPAGKGDYDELFHVLAEHAAEYNSPLTIGGVTPEQLQIFHSLFHGKFIVNKCDECNDYIYFAKDLIELKGKKYHGKRNHLHRFNQEYKWSFSPITDNDFDECIEFSVLSYNSKNGMDNKSSVAEQFALHTFFTNYHALNLSGGLIRINGKIAAFTIGERLNSNTFCVHIEKADTCYNGIYAAINNEFVKFAAPDFLYINREEDLGIEGLRKAKRSYYPAFLLEKNIVTFTQLP